MFDVKLTLVSADSNKTIGPLVNGTVIDRGTYKSVSVIAEPTSPVGSVVFEVDDKPVRTENASPFCLNGDARGDYIPWMPPSDGQPHKLEATAYNGANGTGTKLGAIAVVFTVKDAVVTPPPVVTPNKRTSKVADPNSPSRGDGLTFTGCGTQIISDMFVSGYNQNIVCEDLHPKEGLTLHNVVTVDAWSDAQFQGQGIYISKITGPVNFQQCLFGYNGRPRSKPEYTPTIFRHGVYGQFDASPPTVDSCIFVGNANAGLQLRNGGTVKNCLFIDSGIGILHTAGNVSVEDSLFLGGHYVFDGNWTSLTAIAHYYPMTLTNVDIVGLNTDGVVPTNKPGAKAYDIGAIASGGTWSNSGHPIWVPPPNVPLLVANNVVIKGWRGKPFSGPKAYSGNGVVVKPNPIQYDYRPTINAVINGTLSVVDAIAKIKREVKAVL